MPNSPASTIIIFTRFPVPGKAKTRLIPALGAEGSAAFQRLMTEFTVDQVRQTGLPLEVRYTGGSETEMKQWLGADLSYTPQGEGDLGQRMERAFKDAFIAGAKKVIIIGSDCPDNRAANLHKAAQVLDESSCVIGPAQDGGYYLIGLSGPGPQLFQDIDWGTKNVLAQTLAKIDSYRLLPTLSDVDEPQDIPLQISIIIPTLNEEVSLNHCLTTASTAFNVETIVVDGGSTDSTVEIARQNGATVYQSPEGRAGQMNLGAKKSSGQILLFLHADSELPCQWDQKVRDIIKQPKMFLGHFRFAINGDFFGKKLIEIGTNIRAKNFKKPYGDQGLFLSRKNFETLGGYPDVPILEDVFLVKMAKKNGKIYQVSASLATSGRRWQTHGIIKVTCFNQATLWAAAWGGDLPKLKQLYRNGHNPLRALFK